MNLNKILDDNNRHFDEIDKKLAMYKQRSAQIHNTVDHIVSHFETQPTKWWRRIFR